MGGHSFNLPVFPVVRRARPGDRNVTWTTELCATTSIRDARVLHELPPSLPGCRELSAWLICTLPSVYHLARRGVPPQVQMKRSSLRQNGFGLGVS